MAPVKRSCAKDTVDIDSAKMAPVAMDANSMFCFVVRFMIITSKRNLFKWRCRSRTGNHDNANEMGSATGAAECSQGFWRWRGRTDLAGV